MLMYADDLVLFANSPDALQAEIDQLYLYCQKWKLRVNVDKTKVCVFRKGTRLPRAQWKFGDISLNVTNKIHYLGITLSSNGIFTITQKVLADQAGKAVFLLCQRLSKFKNITPIMTLNLFDKFVTPIISYASEVWGFHKSNDIEHLHLRFCKRQLQVKTTTQNDFIYGELGRYPMYVIRNYKIIRYWLKIVLGKKSALVNSLYMLSLSSIDRNLNYSWVRAVRKLLFEHGFGEVWYNQGVGHEEHFLAVFKLRANDMYKQNWNTRLSDSSRADFYKLYKRNFGTSLYLSEITRKSHRVALTRFFTSSHRLRIETGRWERPTPPPRHQRLCNTCKKLDDEYHFAMECSLNQTLRKELIPPYYWKHPSMYKFLQLLNTENTKILGNLAEYTKKGFDLRRKPAYPDILCIFSYINAPRPFWV